MTRSTRNTITRRIAAFTSTLVAAAAATTLLAAPAGAATSVNGAQAEALAASSQLTHVFTVNPMATTYPNLTSQYVAYRVAVLDVTRSGSSWQTFPWRGSYKITGATGYNDCDALGCAWVTLTNQLRSLPSYTIRGTAGHQYKVDVQFGFYANGWQYSGWTQTESCDTAYQLQGITLNSHGSLCFT
jgi:hypothetical protein